MNPAGITNDVDWIQLVQDKMQALVKHMPGSVQGREFDQIHDLPSQRGNLFQVFQEMQQ